MTPYIAFQLQTYHINTWLTAKNYVDRLSNSSDGKLVRCHELTRAVHQVLQAGSETGVPVEDQLVVQDGKCGSIEHSWMRFKASGHILDVYRPGVLPQVLLLDQFVTIRDYHPLEMRTDIRGANIQRFVKEMLR